MAVGAVSNLLMFLPRVILGTGRGLLMPNSRLLVPKVGAERIYPMVANAVGGQAAPIYTSARALAGEYALTSGTGLRAGASRLMAFLSKGGIRAFGAAGLVGAGILIGGSFLLNVLRHSSSMLGDASRGECIDFISNSAFQGVRYGASLSGLIGLGLCLIPGGAAIGAPIAAASLVTVGGTEAARKVASIPVLRGHSETVGFPWNLIARNYQPGAIG